MSLLLTLLKPADAQNTLYTFPRNEIVPPEELTKNCYSYAQLQYELNGFNQYALPLFPDSNVVNLFRDSIGYRAVQNNFYAAGISFDAKDIEYNFASNELDVIGKYTLYFLNSIFIRYLYERQLHDVTDTLIVHVYPKYNRKDILRFGEISSYNVFATVPYNRSLLEGQNDTGVSEFRIPLTSKDSIFSQGKWGKLELDRNLLPVVHRGSEIAVTVSFKPGYSYIAGDTLYSDSLAPYKKRNIFSLRAVSSGGNKENEYYNNGLFIDRKQAYSNQYQDSILKDAFIPSSLLTPSFFPDISFQIAFFVGIETTQQENTFMYPNPTNSIIRIKGVEHYEQHLEILNAQGKTVYSTTLLPYQQVLNIGHLPAGIYSVKTESREKFWVSKLIKL